MARLMKADSSRAELRLIDQIILTLLEPSRVNSIFELKRHPAGVRFRMADVQPVKEISEEADEYVG